MFLTSFGVYYFTSNGAKSTEKKSSLLLKEINATYSLKILKLAFNV